MPADAHNDAAWLVFWTAAAAAYLSSKFIRWLIYATDTSTPPPERIPHAMTPTTSRPRPLRTIATTIGGLLALINGLIGAGLLTTDQDNTLTAVINAAVTALAAFGIVLFGERKVTPLTDPRHHDGQPPTAVAADREAA